MHPPTPRKAPSCLLFSGCSAISAISVLRLSCRGTTIPTQSGALPTTSTGRASYVRAFHHLVLQLVPQRLMQPREVRTEPHGEHIPRPLQINLPHGADPSRPRTEHPPPIGQRDGLAQ